MCYTVLYFKMCAIDRAKLIYCTDNLLDIHFVSSVFVFLFALVVPVIIVFAYCISTVIDDLQ